MSDHSTSRAIIESIMAQPGEEPRFSEHYRRLQTIEQVRANALQRLGGGDRELQQQQQRERRARGEDGSRALERQNAAQHNTPPTPSSVRKPQHIPYTKTARHQGRPRRVRRRRRDVQGVRGRPRPPLGRRRPVHVRGAVGAARAAGGRPRRRVGAQLRGERLPPDGVRAPRAGAGQRGGRAPGGAGPSDGARAREGRGAGGRGGWGCW